MKQKTLFNLFILLIFILGSCSIEPLENNNCVYEGVKLKTTNINFNESYIIGTWNLECFIDLVDCTIENEPDNSSNPNVIINFKKPGKISGHTNNKFIGSYSIFGGKLKLSINPLTEINENNWTKKFLEAEKITDYVFVDNLKLFVFFNESTKVMVFTKINEKSYE